MATVYVCDGGCGAIAKPPEKFETRGYVNHTHYCPECLEKIDKLLADRDKVHTLEAAHLESRLLGLVQGFLSVNPDFKLPDGPAS